MLQSKTQDKLMQNSTLPPVNLAVIGGSGLYNMPGLQNAQEHDLTTPFGKPSAPVITGLLEGVPVAFLARHGLGHRLSPSEVNYRANIYALKSLGVERVVSISACGSLREDFVPGEIVVPDQLFDHTHRRNRSFFGDGLAAHLSIPAPFCPELSAQLVGAIQSSGAVVHHGGAMITIEGPRFSTRAESNVYRGWGMSLIGMTTSPEAFLAREAELCYGVMAHVTDYDVWHVSEQAVTVDMVIEILHRNTQIAQQAIRSLIKAEQSMTRTCTCGRALADSLITRVDVIPAETRQRLDLLIGKYLP
jgi:5'-methylthioadenosine phosphorylase